MDDADDDCAMELSPSKRHRGKQEPKLVWRRSKKLCQAASCVFSRGTPGQSARAVGNCVFCDPENMVAAMASEAGRMNVRVTLSMFEVKDRAVHEAAMGRVPADFCARELRYCTSPGCVYNREHLGQPARCNGALQCVWCSPSGLTDAIGTDAGRMHVQVSLSMFAAKDRIVYAAALSKLPSDFLRSSKFCCAPQR